MNFSMYFGFDRMCLERGVEATVAFAREHGFSSVEVLRSAAEGSHPIAGSPAAAREVRRVLSGAGLSMACYSVFADTRKPETKERLLEHAELAAELECPFLHHTLLPGLDVTDNSDYPEAVAIALDTAVAVANRAKELGIRCIYEDQGFYVNGVEGFGGFYRQMQHVCDNVGVCMDFGNILFADEAPEVFLEAYKEEVVHVHIKDYLRKKTDTAPARSWLRAANGNWLRDTVVGDGVVDFAACMKILNAMGYKGAFALEIGHPEPFEAGITQAMELLTGLYDPK